MALHGRAFVAIWHGIQTGGEDEYRAWHTQEHMPERLGVPGFLQGRRYVDWSLQPHPTFTLYEGAHIETFRSPGYLARLNDPTEWSNRVQPTMTNFLRGGCETLFSFGNGIGGAIATIRLSAPAGGGESFEGRLAGETLALRGNPAVTSIHIGLHAEAVTGAETEESKMRPSVFGGGFSHVVLIEGTSVAALTKISGALTGMLEAIGARNLWAASYPLDFALRTPA